MERHNDDERAVFEWSTDQPLLNARYRLEWRFRGAGFEVDAPPPQGEARASQMMRGAGIVQRGADVLRQPARHFQLPREEHTAQDVVTSLLTALGRLDELHDFSKGVGLSAPQLGKPVAAAVVRPPSRDSEPVVLLNPRIVFAGTEDDEQFEGCLSFFDYRGRVRRPLRIEVEHARFDGTRVITTFDRAMARLVAHEIDHLEGRLYVDRMGAESNLVPIAEYSQAGQPWEY